MATIRLIPSTYAVSSTSYLSVTNPSNAYANTDSIDYATITNTYASTASRYYYLRGFNFGDIPSNATVNSFTVKIKGYENGLATSTSYAPRLANGTSALSNTIATTNFGTSTKTITIPTGALTWQQIVNYGSSFTIMVYVNRSKKNNTGYFYCQGAEILVDYTVPVYHNVSFTNNSQVVTTDPSTTQTLNEGDNLDIMFYGIQNLDTIDVTDNGTGIKSQFELNGAVYKYTISNIVADHNIVINDAASQSVYRKVNNAWSNYSKIYIKQNNVWVEQSDFEAAFQSNKIYVNK